MNKGTLSSHISRLEEAGYVEVTKTYRGKVPQTLLRLSGAGRKAFTQYRRKLKEALWALDFEDRLLPRYVLLAKAIAAQFQQVHRPARRRSYAGRQGLTRKGYHAARRIAL